MPILTILATALIVITEDVGRSGMLTGNIVQQDLLRDPGLHRSILAVARQLYYLAF
ncbi:MAG: hypothetical protein ACR5K4_00225 [Sodalis sp. (in: enterobacteria)]